MYVARKPRSQAHSRQEISPRVRVINSKWRNVKFTYDGRFQRGATWLPRADSMGQHSVFGRAASGKHFCSWHYHRNQVFKLRPVHRDRGRRRPRDPLQQERDKKLAIFWLPIFDRSPGARDAPRPTEKYDFVGANQPSRLSEWVKWQVNQNPRCQPQQHKTLEHLALVELAPSLEAANNRPTAAALWLWKCRRPESGREACKTSAAILIWPWIKYLAPFVLQRRRTFPLWRHEQNQLVEFRPWLASL